MIVALGKAMAAPAIIDTTTLQLQDTVQTAKGAKQIPVGYADGSQVIWQPKPMNVLWNPSAYNDPEATRLNLSFVPNREAADFLQNLDKWLVNALALESSRLFGQQLSVEEMQRRFQPTLKTHESGSQSIRCKMNVSGRSQVRCWDTFRKPRSQPESWTNCTVTPRIAIRSVWIMGKECGCTLELRDALLEEASTDCPF